MKSLARLFGFAAAASVVASVSSQAFAYDLVCKTTSPDVSMVISADGADGSLDMLSIKAFGEQYGDDSIAQPWTQWRSTYNVNDNVIQAQWPMKDGVKVTLDMKSNHRAYRGTITLAKANGESQTLPMVCK